MVNTKRLHVSRLQHQGTYSLYIALTRRTVAPNCPFTGTEKIYGDNTLISLPGPN